MKNIAFSVALTLTLLMPSAVAAAEGNSVAPQTGALTAAQVIDRIKANVGVPWMTETVDTFKAGDPETPITGVAVTMMATFDVLQRAAAANRNLIITHEPTFYGHQDQTTDLANEKDATFLAGRGATRHGLRGHRDRAFAVREHGDFRRVSALSVISTGRAPLCLSPWDSSATGC
jgi:hypothetical protein